MTVTMTMTMAEGSSVGLWSFAFFRLARIRSPLYKIGRLRFDMVQKIHAPYWTDELA
jgi:hypothetical protein